MRPTRPITFTCEWCYHEVTEDRAPGPTPAYSLQCTDEARRAANAAQVRAHRERTRPPRTGWERPPGRPHKGDTATNDD